MLSITKVNSILVFSKFCEVIFFRKNYSNGVTNQTNYLQINMLQHPKVSQWCHKLSRVVGFLCDTIVTL